MTRTRFALAITATLLVAACGSDDTSDQSTPTSPAGAATTGTDASGASTTVAATTGVAPGTDTTVGPPDSASAAESGTVTLVAYDSFSIDPAVFEPFTAETGLAVSIVNAGDTGTMLSKAVLTAGNPEGDVMWGVDNTLLARAVAGDVFEPYETPALAELSPAATALVPGHEATPVDEGDVCVNFDIAWFEAEGLPMPVSLSDLTDTAYKDLLVVENAATSSPGLAFLLATIAEFGDEGWTQYWSDLRANGVEVVDSWDVAYYESFSGSSGKGPRPLVVSYGSSPPAEVIYGDPVPETAPTGVIESTCFHQVEFAGVLRGTDHPEGARRLIDFLVSPTFQEALPLSLFVYPVRTGTPLPPEFEQWAVRPADPLTLPPAEIEDNAEEWIAEWTDLVVR